MYAPRAFATVRHAGDPHQQRDSPNSPVACHVLTLCLPSNTGLSSTDYSARRVRAFFCAFGRGFADRGFARMVNHDFADYIESAFRALRSLYLRVRYGGLFFLHRFCTRNRSFERYVTKKFPAPKKKQAMLVGSDRLSGMSRGVNVPLGKSIQQHQLQKNPALEGHGLRFLVDMPIHRSSGEFCVAFCVALTGPVACDAGWGMGHARIRPTPQSTACGT